MKTTILILASLVIFSSCSNRNKYFVCKDIKTNCLDSYAADSLLNSGDTIFVNNKKVVIIR